MGATGKLQQLAKNNQRTEAEQFDLIVSEGKTLFGMGKLLDCQPSNVVYWLKQFEYSWDASTRSWIKRVAAEEQPQPAA